jgi:hypothetical protein
MGLRPHVAEALVRECIHRPLAGDVVLIGRQTVYLTAAQALDLLRRNGIEIGMAAEANIEIDRSTLNRLAGYEGLDLITDRALFRLLGVPHVQALDHSDYEGAEIIHDLTKPVPAELRSCADLIFDGSTLDNCFDPATVIGNFAEMLRPGGRLITTNVYSNHFEPYVMLPPLWFLDYFTVNGFADCKVYILDHGSAGVDVFTIDLDALLDPARVVSAFVSPNVMATIVLAEKGPASTSHVKPAQQHYRSATDWVSYRDNLRIIKANPRPHVVRSRSDIRFFDVRGGHLFVASDFTARDPMSEIRRLGAA